MNQNMCRSVCAQCASSCVSIISIHHQLLAGICCHDMKAFFPWTQLTQLLCNVAETPSFLVGVAKGGPGSLSFGRNLQVKTRVF